MSSKIKNDSTIKLLDLNESSATSVSRKEGNWDEFDGGRKMMNYPNLGFIDGVWLEVLEGPDNFFSLKESGMWEKN